MLHLYVCHTLRLASGVCVHRTFACGAAPTYVQPERVTRAKRAIIAISFAAAVNETSLSMGCLKRNILLIRVLAASVNGTRVSVIVSCYTLMAVNLLIETRLFTVSI